MPIDIPDARFEPRHVLAHTRFDFKSRDAPLDLLIRSSRKSDRYDCFGGTAYIGFPTLAPARRVDRNLPIGQRGPSFGAIEFSIGKDRIQFSTRRPGSAGGRQRRPYSVSQSRRTSPAADAPPRATDPAIPAEPVFNESGQPSTSAAPVVEAIPDATTPLEMNSDRAFTAPSQPF